MTVLIIGLALFFSAFSFHLLIWRIRIPNRQTKTLLFIFFGILALWLISSLLSPVIFSQLGLPVPANPYEYFHIALFFISLTLAYMITYSAIEVDSPSLVMVKIIADAGPEGLLKSKFEELMTEDILVKPRIRDLLRDKMVKLDGEVFSITPKGTNFVRIFIFYRKLLKAPLGG